MHSPKAGGNRFSRAGRRAIFSEPMQICPRCTTENPDWTAKCQYCIAPLDASAHAAAVVASATPMWALAPQAYRSAIQVQTPWRESKRLVLYHGTPLPDRCVQCNAPAHGLRLNRRLTWHHPAYLLLLFLGVLPYAIVASVVQMTYETQVGICAKHRRRRRWAIAGGWTFGILGIAVFPWLAITFEAGWIAGVGAGLALVGVVGGSLIARVVRAAKIDEHRIWMSGVHPDYLAELPPPPPYG